MFHSSLFAYIAVNRMPNIVKLYHKKTTCLPSYLTHNYVRHRLRGCGGFESLCSFSGLRANGGQCPGRTEERTVQSTQSYSDSEVVYFVLRRVCRKKTVNSLWLMLKLWSQEAVLHQVATVQTHLIQQRDVLQSLTLALGYCGAAGACLDCTLFRCLGTAMYIKMQVGIQSCHRI